MFDVIIIGSGPAGMTAAIYAKRAGLNVLILEGSAPGGQINKTVLIENYPGFKEIDGPSLAIKMFEQISSLNIEYRYGNVLEIIDKGNNKLVKTDKEEILGKAVIIATGRKSKELGIENENKLTGRGISWCAVCDGPLFKNKEVIVIGGGNSAVEESLYLSDIASKVTLIHRRNELRADNILQDKIKNNPKINILWDTIPIKFNEKDNKLDSVTVKNKVTDKEYDINCDGIFIYIGFIPVTNIINKFDISDKMGYIITDEDMRTKVKGIYAAGDVRKKELFQITTAISDGAIAAISVKNDLNS
ncbi:MAG: thioredoxin-disulfide reductase [Bacilli bacterium]